MNVGRLIRKRFSTPGRSVIRLRSFDDVGRSRHVGLRWLFLHAWDGARDLPEYLG
jgi:hypothetical protein